MSALAGGVVFTLAWLAGFRVSYAMGLWHAGDANVGQTAGAVPFWT